MTNSLKTGWDIQSKIYTIRGVQVMLDRDLAQLYTVTTGNLNLAVKRNSERFSNEFMFKLTKAEVDTLRLQFASANISPKSRSLPSVFTEYGALMLSSILKSQVSIEVNKQLIKAFIELRKVTSTTPAYQDLHQLIKKLETRLGDRLDLMNANHIIDKTIMSNKITAVSKETMGLSDDIKRLSDVLDQFENAHIIIKRPKDTEHVG